MDTKEWVPPAFVFTYKLFRTAANYTNALTSYRKVPTLLSDFNQIWHFAADLHKSFQYQISRKSLLRQPNGRTNMYDVANRRF